MPRSQQGLLRLLRREGIDERIVDAFAAVPREAFVPPEGRIQAYSDRPVPLPERQTTSQPSLIARMIEATSPGPTDRALEVGTGYGFQTALLGKLVQEVVSIERFEVLSRAAAQNLAAAGIENVRLLVGDGWKGAPHDAPFDVIVVSAAASEVPGALEEQLAEGGRLVIPVTGATSDEVLLFHKRNGEVQRVAFLTPARFVPLVKEEEA